jgi:predicted transcriptional regulator
VNKIESGIINVLRQGVPLRARAIANVLGVSRREVNHYLYTSLQALVIQDQQYRWVLKSSLRQAEQLSLTFEMEQEPSSLDELLEQHQQQVKETTLERTLRSLIDFSEE